MFGIKRMALVAPLLALVTFAAPVEAATPTVLTGVTTGTVNLFPALTVTPSTTSFTFSGAVLSPAVFVTTACPGGVATGSINPVNAAGSTVVPLGETVAAGAGFVTALTGSGSSTCGALSVSLLTPSTPPDNEYVRVGPDVKVYLWLQVCVTVNGVPICVTVWVAVWALFTPNGTLPPYNSASFTGAFAGGGA
jgi:hypothetical protein